MHRLLRAPIFGLPALICPSEARAYWYGTNNVLPCLLVGWLNTVALRTPRLSPISTLSLLSHMSKRSLALWLTVSWTQPQSQSGVPHMSMGLPIRHWYELHTPISDLDFLLYTYPDLILTLLSPGDVVIQVFRGL